jgi:peptide/nickel transport system substrate-binding protein
MEPFTKPEARQAMRFILEREPMVKSFLFGLGSVGNDHPIVSSSPYYTQKPLNTRDIEKVKGLLAQAGVQTPWNIELWTSSERPPSQKMAVAFKELAEPAGIIVEVKDVPQAVYAADVSRKKPLYTVNRFGRATLYEQVYLWFHGKAGFNYSQVSLSEKMDTLLDQMAAETDTAKRKEIVSQVIDEMQVSGHHVIPYFLNYNSALSDKVQGYWPSPNLWVDVRETWIKSK